jgi:hypothetical protein
MSDIDEQDYEYQDYYEDDEPEMMAERGAYERAGPARDDILGTLIGSGTNKLEELNKKLFRLNLTKQEKFQIFLSVFFEKLEPYLGLSQTHLDRIISISKRVSKIEYKNPIAFILGYYVCDKEGNIKEDSIEDIKNQKILNKFDEVTLPDVIRYARLLKQYI